MLRIRALLFVLTVYAVANKCALAETTRVGGSEEGVADCVLL